MREIQLFLLNILFFFLNYDIWDPFETEGNFSIVKLVTIIYIASIVLGGNFSYFKPNRYQRYVYAPFIVMFFLMIINNILNYSDRYNEIVNSTILLWLILSVVIVNQLSQSQERINKVLLWFALGSISEVIFYLLGIGIDVDLFEQTKRMTLFGDDQNSIGIRMVLSSVIIIYYTIIKPLKMNLIFRIALLCAVPLMIYFVVQTGSRSALLLLSLSFLLLITFTKGMSALKRFYISFSIIAVAVFSILTLLDDQETMNRIMLSVKEKDLSGRDAIWKAQINLVDENLVFGVGRNGYLEYNTQIGNVSRAGTVRSAHNVFLETLCYTGIIGLVFFLVFVWRLLKYSIFTYKRERIILPAILFTTLLIYLINLQLFTNKTAWAIIAVITAYYSFLKQTSINENIRNNT